jgi:hypothetical protein
MIWQVGFRGQGDCPFWTNDPIAPTDSAGRGEIIENAIDVELQLLKDNVDPDPQFFTSTLWMEMNDLYKGGDVIFPDTVKVIWCDNGEGTMRSMSDAYESLPDIPMGGKHGVYYHVDFQNGWYNQLCQTVSPTQMRYEFCRTGGIIDKECTAYVMLNVGDIRQLVMGIKAISEIGWDVSPWDNNSDYDEVYYDKWCLKYFGEAASDLAKQSYKALFNSPWIHHNSFVVPRKAGIQGLMAYARLLITNKYSSSTWWSGYYGTYTTDQHINLLIPKCSSAFTAWDNASATAQNALSLIPVEKQQYFKDDVKLQIELSRACNKYLYYLCLAIQYDKNAQYKEAYANIYSAVAELDKVFVLEKDAEWGKWKGWYNHDIIAGIPSAYTVTVKYKTELQSKLFPYAKVNAAANPSYIMVNGISSTTITAVVVDTNNITVVSPPVYLKFTVSDGVGTITGTNPGYTTNGTASAVLTSTVRIT